MSKLKSVLKKDKNFILREEFQNNLLRRINSEKDKIKLGGGKKAIDNLQIGRASCRERV